MSNLKDTGIVRKVDELGRVVLPLEMRRSIGIEEKDALSVLLDSENNSIVLKPVEAKCVFCGTVDNIRNHGNSTICTDCIENIKNL